MHGRNEHLECGQIQKKVLRKRYFNDSMKSWQCLLKFYIDSRIVVVVVVDDLWQHT